MAVRTDRIYAVVWTPRRHKIVASKAEGRREMVSWRQRYEQVGWKIRTSGPDAYIAKSPLGLEHAISFHEYDRETKERIWWKPPKPKVEKTPAAPKHRRGRIPVGA